MLPLITTGGLKWCRRIEKKPRTYREIARKVYLSLIKLRRPSNTAIAVPAMEFGAKISVSLIGKGLAHVDKLHWDAQHEGHDPEAQVEACKKRYGYYPEVVMADTLYGSRDNRSYLERKHIRFSGKPLGRSPKITPENKDELMRLKTQRRREYRERIPIEGKFGYRLNNIRAKRSDTSVAWINSIFLVMNLLILVWAFICLKNLAARMASSAAKKSTPSEIPFACACQFFSNRNFYLAAHN